MPEKPDQGREMTKLSVNLNKFALLRNARGTDFPNLRHMAQRTIAAGAHGLTIHPRPDQRHATYADCHVLSDLLKDNDDVEFNIEGNPVPKFLEVVTAVKPDQCTLVPDASDQLTSDHGWDLIKDEERLRPIIESLHAEGIRVSLFMDAEPEQIARARDIGADRIELYTEPYAQAFGTSSQQDVFQAFYDTAVHAHGLGLGVNAGHDLNLANLAHFLSIPNILEVSIGHAIVVEAFDYGYEDTLRRYLDIIVNT
jgi:pyridoxine 5-phosphate synthase